MKKFVLSALLAAVTLPAAANEFMPAMESYLSGEVRAWSSDPILLETLRSQNAITSSYDQATIDAMDKAWRAEVGASNAPTIEPIISNSAAEFLREMVNASGGQMTEIILMDATGLNAAVSHVTSDMWQGDEAKYTETYAAGPGAVHFGDIEKDESTGHYQGQISFSVVDPSSGELLGAITVGVNAESLL